MSLAYEGVRILDFSQLVSAPLATHQLAMLGADVIKVERLGVGDQFAGVWHTDRSRDSSRAFPFQATNQGKRSLAIDLKKPEAISIILNLAERCDAVVENFSAGAMGRLGLGYEDVRKVNPNVVYCSVTGYGQKGPKAGIAAYDGAVQAASGMMSITGDTKSGPMRAGYMPVDVSTALMAAFALSSALYRKLTTGEGQYIDVAMMDTAVLLQMPMYMNYMNAGVVPPMLGNRSPTYSPTSDTFPTRDGHIQLTAVEETHNAAIFKTLGLAEAYADPKYSSEEARRANETTLMPLLNHAFSTDTSANWWTKLSEAGVACAIVAKIPDVVKDEQFKHRSLFVDVPMAGKSDSAITTLATSFVMSNETPRVHAAPTLGQHTDEILSEFGYSAGDIVAFREKSII